MELEKFELLGRKIDALLARVEELTREKSDLTRLLEKRDEEILNLSDRISVFEQERDQIRNRVDDLLGRIDRQTDG